MNYEKSSISEKNIINNLVTVYNENAATHNYIFGYIIGNAVYYTVLNDPDLKQFVYLDHTSKGDYCLRFKPTKNDKETLYKMNYTKICDKVTFNQTVKEFQYNRGEIFEKMLSDKFNIEWKKDNIPFTDDGDITINEIKYQIKFEKASFITEKFANILKNKAETQKNKAA